MFSIQEVNNKTLLKQFIKFPNKLYKNDPNFIPHIYLERILFFNEKINPFFKDAKVKNYLAIKENNEIVGRISAIINFAHNKFHNDKVGFFGNFDSIDDISVATKLFKTAENFLKQNNLEIIRGPMSFSTNHECALLIKGFDEPPKIMMTYNYPYYSKLIEENGFEKAKDLLAYYLDIEKINKQRLQKASNLIQKRYNIKIRTANFKKFKQELDIIFHIYNAAWEKNWGFVPMTKEEFYFSSSSLKYIADENLILIAEIDNKPIGFIIGLPDINQIIKEINGKLFPFGIFKLLSGKKKLDTMRVITLGIVKEHRNKALDVLLVNKIFEQALTYNYPKGECSWILEDNEKMNNALIKLGANVYKIYRIYEKII